MATTALEVARKAGVSQSAVSRAYTPGAPVSAATRAKVLAAAAELGYRPNALARALITGRSRLVGLVLGEIADPERRLAVAWLLRALQARGRHVLTVITQGGGADAERAVREALDYRVEGILTAFAAPPEGLAALCAEAGAPVVQVDPLVERAGTPVVACDDFAGGRRLARFLARRGDRRIALIAGGASPRAREAGFRAGLAESGLRLVARAAGGDCASSARAAALDLFRGGVRPDAVCAADGRMGLAALEAIRGDLGLRVPEDVAVVAHDDAPEAARPAYALTSLRRPLRRMAAAAAEALTAAIAGAPAPPRRIAAPGLLIIRGSAPDAGGRTDAAPRAPPGPGGEV